MLGVADTYDYAPLLSEGQGEANPNIPPAGMEVSHIDEDVVSMRDKVIRVVRFRGQT